jgi:hypothetical protein
VAFVKTLLPFQNNGAFDLNKYNDFKQNRLPSLGASEAQIEELVSDQLALNRLKDLLGAGLHVADSETDEYYNQAYGKLHVAVVRFRNEDFQKDVKVSDEEVAKYFEAHKADLKTEEKRKVEFVAFVLNDEEKKLTGKEKVDALKKLTKPADDFVQATLEKGAQFPEVAAKFKLNVAATAEFSSTAPDPQFVPIPALTQAAFALKPEEPVSDRIQGPDGFYVIHLLGITPSRPLALEEAKPKITETLSKEKLKQLVSSRGNDVARTVREALKAGTPLDTAMSQMGLQAERLAPFSIVETPTPTPKPEDPKKPEEPKVPDLMTIKSAMRDLNPGDASEFLATDKGGLVAVLEKRDPGDPAGYAAAKATFEKNYLQSKRMVAFDEWLHDRRRAAGLQMPTAPTAPAET